MEDMKKMTSREFYQAVLDGVIGETEKEYAQAQLTKLDEVNEKRKNKPSKASLENAPYEEAILALLAGATGEVLAKEIALGIEISTQKTTAILTKLAEEGKVEKIVPTVRSKPISYKIVQ